MSEEATPGLFMTSAKPGLALSSGVSLVGGFTKNHVSVASVCGTGTTGEDRRLPKGTGSPAGPGAWADV